jgi:hypothetical protein
VHCSGCHHHHHFHLLFLKLLILSFSVIEELASAFFDSDINFLDDIASVIVE